MRRHVRGFTLAELVVVMAIIGILARIALPATRSLVRKAQATRVVGDFHAVRIAAYNFQADSLKWPPEAASGTVPRGLANYLPRNFTFNRGQYRLDYENWSSGSRAQRATGVTIGISVVTTDAALGNQVVKLLGSGTGARWTVGSSYTFVILASGSSF